MADTPTRSLLRTADVDPLDVDGVLTVSVGTALWVVAGIVLLPFQSRLEAAGQGWWIWTCVSGAVLGGAGILYCLYRRRPRKAQPRESAEPSGSSGSTSS